MRTKWEEFLYNCPIPGVISLKMAELPLKLSLEEEKVVNGCPFLLLVQENNVFGIILELEVLY